MIDLPHKRFYMLLHGHVLDRLRDLPDESVDCVMTSPPYWGLRLYRGAESVWGGDPNCEHDFSNAQPADLMHENRNNRRGTQEEVMANPTGTTYIRRMRGQPHGDTAQVGNTVNDAQPPELPMGATCPKCGAWKGQLGLEPRHDMYLDHLLMVTAELKRVLKKSGTLWWNMGDTYVGGHKGGSIYNDEWNITKTDAIPQISQGRPQSKVKGIPEKSLMLIPERFAMRMVDEQGWTLRNLNLWYKPNHMPSSASDRLTNSYEFVMFFVKARKYFFDLDSIRKPIAPASIQRTLQVSPQQYQSGKSVDGAQTFGMNNIPRILTGMHKKLEAFATKHDEAVGRTSGSYQDPLHTKAYHPSGKNPGDVLRFKRSCDEPVIHEHDINKNGHSGYYDKEGNLLVNPNGPNPGDVLNYDSKYLKDEYGQPLQGFVRVQSIAERRRKSREEAAKLFPGDPQKQQEYINFVHDHSMHPLGKNPGDILDYAEWYSNGMQPDDFWEITTRPHPFAHFAVYPVELCYLPIKAGCPKDGVVLDPFAGSGTTGVAARELGRSSILIEISDEYCKIAKQRMQWGQQTLDGTEWIEK